MEIQAIWEIAETLSSILVAANYNNTFKHLTIALYHILLDERLIYKCNESPSSARTTVSQVKTNPHSIPGKHVTKWVKIASQSCFICGETGLWGQKRCSDRDHSRHCVKIHYYKTFRYTDTRDFPDWSTCVIYFKKWPCG